LILRVIRFSEKIMHKQSPDERPRKGEKSGTRLPHCASLQASQRLVLQAQRVCITTAFMKTLTVRLPEALVAEIEAESRERRRSKSDVVRERLTLGAETRSRRKTPEIIADLAGSVDGLPADLSERKKAYLKATGYGRKRPR
jgi:Arc/MetJ-type ribon-helix-helix transcriptional regulator